MTDAKSLAQYAACDVSDALVAQGVADGGFVPNLVQRSALGAPTAVGRAYTVLYAPKDDPRPAVATSYIDQVPSGSVVVVGLAPECQITAAPFVTVNNALYGGLMSTRAQYLGAAASVVLGRTTAPGPVVKVVGINVPLTVKTAAGDLTIAPDDVVVADENGVVCVPSHVDLAQLLQYIPRRVHADENVAEDIRHGRPAAEAQKFWRGKM
ncbi:putative bifunctional 4-hydroxy-4-methyl-2-oxoglutarate aldolase/oxaloacetate decarboxylase [Clavispora lusitaniae]|uniref:Bifunctional 4-hydroxy-4-methyl-2-oxoglutarate aldolase/oxaloacetate decarboxylase n=1 Tax=Clavispora lusitaniae TaxID=36911 RepID=A0AA91PWS1_CLALS|nr:putative bifunctional 4-hydroxy-4-methyl-2-oxoglutarate aldolase/oxaloacetate decarboxylase [Clavispora lusitaniae]